MATEPPVPVKKRSTRSKGQEKSLTAAEPEATTIELTPPTPLEVELLPAKEEKKPELKAITPSLRLNVSKTLYDKLLEQSHEEGIGLNDYVLELISQGCVRRAWDIFEIKSKPQNTGANYSQSQQRFANQQGHPNKKRDSYPNHRRKGGHQPSPGSSRYNSIMDDKASFLEYVRNQEKGFQK